MHKSYYRDLRAKVADLHGEYQIIYDLTRDRAVPWQDAYQERQDAGRALYETIGQQLDILVGSVLPAVPELARQAQILWGAASHPALVKWAEQHLLRQDPVPLKAEQLQFILDQITNVIVNNHLAYIDVDTILDEIAKVSARAGITTSSQLGLPVSGFKWTHPREQFKTLMPDLERTAMGYLEKAAESWAGVVSRMVVAAANPNNPQTMAELSKDIRRALPELSRKRAAMIAQTETARAYGTVAHEVMVRNGIKSRRWMTAAASPIAKRRPVCPLCIANAAAGWVPISKPFPSGAMAPPQHPLCRCDIAAQTKNWLPPKDDEVWPPILEEEVEPPVSVNTFGDRARALIAKGVNTEEAVRNVGAVVATEFDKRLTPRVEEMAKLKKELADRYAEITQQIAALDRELAETYASGQLADRSRLSDEIDRLAKERREMMPKLGEVNMSIRKLYRDLTKEVIGEIRPMGVDKDTPVPKWASGSSVEIRKLVTQTWDYFPRAWIEKTATVGATGANNGELQAKKAGRGYYRNYAGAGKPAQIVISGDGADGSLSTAFHEMGHRFEYTVPGILDLETQFYQRRTEGEPLRHLGAGYGRGEQTRKDQFVESYMGKDYGGRAWELLSMGNEAIYMNTYGLDSDQDFRTFILGLLAAI